MVTLRRRVRRRPINGVLRDYVYRVFVRTLAVLGFGIGIYSSAHAQSMMVAASETRNLDAPWADLAGLETDRRGASRPTLDLRFVNGAESDWPNIEDPGPDMGDFPNSAFTLPKGKVQIESAPFTMISADSNAAGAYAWPYLFRYGVTDALELRFLGNGLTSVFGSSGTTGFSPAVFDLKAHLWDGNKRWIPAAALEVYLLTELASPAFKGGLQPSLNMNFDLPFGEKTNLEVTAGYSGVRDVLNVVTGERVTTRFQHLQPRVHQPGVNVYQFSLQWAVEHDVTERIQLFVHGYYSGALLLQQGSGNVIGVGGFYKINDRWMTFGSCNAGLDDAVAPLSTQLGFAFAL